jgi:hypothetical protein
MFDLTLILALIITIIIIIILVFRYSNNNEKLIISDTPVGPARHQQGEYRPLFILHHTNWCPACKTFRPLWTQLITDPAIMLHYECVENDEDKNPTAGVRAFPTLSYIRGPQRIIYNGPMDFESIKKWLFQSPVNASFE